MRLHFRKHNMRYMTQSGGRFRIDSKIHEHVTIQETPTSFPTTFQFHPYMLRSISTMSQHPSMVISSTLSANITFYAVISMFFVYLSMFKDTE
jgi:hypothetical protein